jgi:hypothetical protein
VNRKSLGIALGGIAPAALLGATLVIAFAAGSQERGASFSPYVDEQGNIERPTGFRENWAHLGTYFVPDDEHARGPGVHDVYASKETVEAFKQTGEFPDGAVLVRRSGASSRRR